MDPQRTEPDHLLHITLQAEGLVFYELECVIGVCMGGKPGDGCIVQDQFAEVGGELLGDAEWPRDVSPIPVYAKQVGDDVVLLPMNPEHNQLLRADAKVPLLKDIVEMVREYIRYVHMEKSPQSYHWPMDPKTFHPSAKDIERAKEQLLDRLTRLLYMYYGNDFMDPYMWKRLREIALRESMNAPYSHDVGLPQRNIYSGYIYGPDFNQKIVSKNEVLRKMGKFTNITES